MGMRISTNVTAINAQRNLVNSQRGIQKSMGQLASGNKINVAADDAAGLAISENLKAQIRSARMASQNANNAISMIQVAEGGMNEISNIVVRLRELGIQASSDTVGDKERVLVDKEVQQLKLELERIAKVTTWGSVKLLDGSSPTFDFQVGIYNDPTENRISFDASQNQATLSQLGLEGLDYTTKEGAQDSLKVLDDAQTSISGMRSNMGALQNRFNSTIDNLAIFDENISAANARIRDTDVAVASSEMARNNILLQASTATLAQANQVPQLALKLIS